MNATPEKKSRGWIPYAVLAVGFAIFTIVFVKLQSDHGSDVKECTAKCVANGCKNDNPRPRQRSAFGETEDPQDVETLCEGFCSLAGKTIQKCLRPNMTCDELAACVITE